MHIILQFLVVEAAVADAIVETNDTDVVETDDTDGIETDSNASDTEI